MDIVNHAVAGAIIGSKFNAPILGALAGIAPDLIDTSLAYQRRDNPTFPYVLVHSFEICIIILLIGIALEGLALGFALAWCSHIILDYLTHNKAWGPRFIFFPAEISIRFEEWEFFNRSWWRGLILNLIFCVGVLSI